MFVACGIWCLADVSSVSPSSRLIFSPRINDPIAVGGESLRSKQTFCLPRLLRELQALLKPVSYNFYVYLPSSQQSRYYSSILMRS